MLVGLEVVQPDRGAVQEEPADFEALFERIAEVFGAHEDLCDRDVEAGDDRERPFGRVGDRGERVDGRHLDGKARPADSGELGRQHQEIGTVRQGRQRPGEDERQRMGVGRFLVVGQVYDEILEGEDGARVDLQRQVQVERSTARLLGVQIHLPRLSHGVALHEMPFVMHVEAVTGRVILEVCDESGDIDDSQGDKPATSGAVCDTCAGSLPWMRDDELMAVLRATADAVGDAFRHGVGDYRRRGDRPGQYALDLVTDAAAIEVLDGAGLGVLSEESGRHHPERDLCVVVDPIDGSTNASRGIPWYATSLAAVDADGVRAALVVNQAGGVRYEATRGGGATRNGVAIRAADVTALSSSLVLLNGSPPAPLRWRQYRAFGAAALDLCLVAEGAAEAYIDFAGVNLGVWDYLAALLIVTEAGGVMVDAEGEGLVVLDHGARRCPVAAATGELLDEILRAWEEIER